VSNSSFSPNPSSLIVIENKRYPNGIYSGQVYQDQRWGQGKIVFSNNDTYEGEWANDLPHGKGTYIHANSGEKYEG